MDPNATSTRVPRLSSHVAKLDKIPALREQSENILEETVGLQRCDEVSHGGGRRRQHEIEETGIDAGGCV